MGTTAVYGLFDYSSKVEKSGLLLCWGTCEKYDGMGERKWPKET